MASPVAVMLSTPAARSAAHSQEEGGPFRRPDLPVDELHLVALLVSVPSLAKFAASDAVERLGHPGLAHVARVLIQVARDGGKRINQTRSTAMALADASWALRLVVCTASLALGEVRNPHEALHAAADAIGACSRCRSRRWRAAVLTATGRVCHRCVVRRRGVVFRRDLSPPQPREEVECPF
jgi:hypothetical protein